MSDEWTWTNTKDKRFPHGGDLERPAVLSIQYPRQPRSYVVATFDFNADQWDIPFEAMGRGRADPYVTHWMTLPPLPTSKLPPFGAVHCPECGGVGIKPEFMHHRGGECRCCTGLGYITIKMIDERNHFWLTKCKWSWDRIAPRLEALRIARAEIEAQTI